MTPPPPPTEQVCEKQNCKFLGRSWFVHDGSDLAVRKAGSQT